MEGNFEYYAFISYCREDEKEAKWLQKKIEKYKLSSIIRKEIPRLPKYARPVFRDKTDMKAGDLNVVIKEELARSKFLIVICSPRSTQSEWVGKEINLFVEMGYPERIIPFVVDGEPNSDQQEKECFHQALKDLDCDLLGININEIGRNEAFVKTIAQLLDVRFGMLWDRFKIEQKRKKIYRILQTLLGLLIMFFLYFIVIIGFHSNYLQNAFRLANNNNYITSILVAESASKTPFKSTIDKLVFNQFNWETLDEMITDFKTTLAHNQQVTSYVNFNHLNTCVTKMAFTEDGKYIVTSSADGAFGIWDSSNSKLIRFKYLQNRVNSFCLLKNTLKAIVLFEDQSLTICDLNNNDDYDLFSLDIPTGENYFYDLCIDDTNQFGAIYVYHLNPNEITPHYIKPIIFSIKDKTLLDKEDVYTAEMYENGDYVKYTKNHEVVMYNLTLEGEKRIKSPFNLPNDEHPIQIMSDKNFVAVLTNKMRLVSYNFDREKLSSYQFKGNYNVCYYNRHLSSLIISTDNELLSYNVEDMHQIYSLDLKGFSFDIDEDREELHVPHNNGILVFDARNGEEKTDLSTFNCTSLYLASSRDKMAIGHTNGTVCLYDMERSFEDKEIKLSIDTATDEVVDMTIDGKYICYVTNSSPNYYTINVCKSDSGDVVYRAMHDANYDRIQLSQDLSRIYMIKDNYIHTYDTKKGMWYVKETVKKINYIDEMRYDDKILIIYNAETDNGKYFTVIETINKDDQEHITFNILVDNSAYATISQDEKTIISISNTGQLIRQSCNDSLAINLEEISRMVIPNDFGPTTKITDAYFDESSSSIISLTGYSSKEGLVISNVNSKSGYRRTIINPSNKPLVLMRYDQANRKIRAISKSGVLHTWNIYDRETINQKVDSIINGRELTKEEKNFYKLSIH